jgi:hypothetical protein
MSEDIPERRPIHDKLDMIRQLRADELERLQKSTDPFPKRLPGQPYSDYERAVIMDEIFELMSEGQALTLICTAEHMPSPATVNSWLKTDAELGRRYEALALPRARALFELALWEVQRARDREAMLIAEKRANLYLKAAALLDPKAYSDKTHTQLGKSGGTAPVSITLNIGGDSHEVTRELVVIPQPESGDIP